MNPQVVYLFRQNGAQPSCKDGNAQQKHWRARWLRGDDQGFLHESMKFHWSSLHGYYWHETGHACHNN